MSNLNQSDLKSMEKMYLQTFNFNLLDSKNINHPFYKNYRKLLATEPNSEEYKYIFYNVLFGPLEYIQELKNVSESDFEEWKTRLVNNTNNVGFYGDIFELYINWTLVRKDFVIKKSERPDFTIIHNSKEVFIECTSAQFDFDKNPTTKEIFKKIKSTVRSKIVEDYMNLSTSLFIDITNLIYHSKKLNLEINSEFLLKALSSVDNDLKKNPPVKILKPLGSVRFFYFDAFQNQSSVINFACNIIGDFKNPNAD